MAKKRRKRKSRPKRPDKKSKTSIRLKPNVKKKLLPWITIIKIALMVVCVYYASKWTVHKFWDWGWIGQSRKISQGSPAAAANPSVTRRDPAQSTIATFHRPVRKKRMLSPDKPKIVLVIDDIGHTLKNRDQLVALGDQVTYAILPMLAYSRYFSQLSFHTGAEVILHLPLEAQDDTIPGPGLITSRMSEDHLREILARDLRSVPQHLGVNNHMGSEGTSDSYLMNIILSELKKRDLFFLDSQTTEKSVTGSIGKRIGVTTLSRDIFLDNVDEPRPIRDQLQKLKRTARSKGYAIGIGHYRENTLTVLNQEIPRMKDQGFEIIGLTDLIGFKAETRR